MHKGISKCIFFFITILHFCLLNGCINKGSTNKKLYFEPPPRLIRDYIGMIEGEELNWVWLKLGTRFTNYQSITIKPFQNLTSEDDQYACERLHQGLITWFKKNDITLSDNGEIICEGAIVDFKFDRGFIKEINPFYEEYDDLFLELELVMIDETTQDTICKIRHGAVGVEVDVIIKQVLADLIRYFESHK